MDSCVSWMGSELVLGALAGGGLFVGMLFCGVVFFVLCGLDWLSRLCFGLGYVVLSWSWVCLGWFWLGACLVSVSFVVNFCVSVSSCLVVSFGVLV